MRDELRDFLRRATPDPAEQASDYARIRAATRRPSVERWVGAGVVLTAAAALLLLWLWPTTAPDRGLIQFRAADVPGAQPVLIEFSYPEGDS